MALASALIEILRGPTIGNVFMELFLFLGPLWVAVLVGVLVGWSWKPKWANLGRDKVDWSPSSSSSSPSSSLSMGGFISPQSLNFGSMPVFNSMKVQLPSCISWISDNGAEKETFAPPPPIVNTDCSSLQMDKDKPLVVAEDDLDHLIKLVEVTNGGLTWNPVMDRSTQNMYYQAWRREPETGPPQYRSRAVFEDATPELVREFFWDDQFRQSAKWDDMLLYSKTLEQCPTTGTMILQWIRKNELLFAEIEYMQKREIDLQNDNMYLRAKIAENERAQQHMSLMMPAVHEYEAMTSSPFDSRNFLQVNLLESAHNNHHYSRQEQTTLHLVKT